ncbi:flagellar hook-basal body complex protein FliE [Curtobacterium sp. MCBA15_001]|uniref:flagellar hook-basal body complex protein FliE n=1 Tax=Curtobacterium sp. MCBA15_001 TaxID=1898731 RepID=UPI0008DDE14F|nr:flagellar hook-basal body complex protein FliE [Curtobacterium sp. MCBA15_001]OIH93756.1 flagellar hook-basal body complex protein FliE [Curtobacterium sp. MCBA15_001]
MPIDAVNGVTTNALSGVSGMSVISPNTSTQSATGVDGSFATSLGNAVDGLQELQSTSKTLALKAVTGNLDDIHDATIASTRAQVTLELVAAVRNKGVDAFNEIMRMQA